MVVIWIMHSLSESGCPNWLCLSKASWEGLKLQSCEHKILRIRDTSWLLSAWIVIMSLWFGVAMVVHSTMGPKSLFLRPLKLQNIIKQSYVEVHLLTSWVIKCLQSNQAQWASRILWLNPETSEQVNTQSKTFKTGRRGGKHAWANHLFNSAR